MELRVGGKYRLGKKLGSGSFGDIYLGTNMTTGEEVAIKLERISSKRSQLAHEWKLYTSLNHCIYGGERPLQKLGGSWWILLYYRCLGADIGRDVCLYPRGASPSMTEPDLVRIGDRVCIENASLVAHTNAMGRYQLFTLRVGDDCTLQDRCRLMAGAEMLSSATLLEHSLVMSGDVVPSNMAWQV